MTTSQRCDEHIIHQWGYRQCSRAGVLAHGSKYYCRQHHPDAVAARQAASAAKQREVDAKSPCAQVAKLSARCNELTHALRNLATRWDGCPEDQRPREVRDAFAVLNKEAA